MPGETASEARLPLRLYRITWEAPGVLSLDFMDPAGHELPPFGPGAHVDLILPDGQVRQYSLCGDPADRMTDRVGVREVENGRASQPRSCEQGICGTCDCHVLEGEVDHRHSILAADERAANQVMMVCVSRARSERLVLGL